MTIGAGYLRITWGIVIARLWVIRTCCLVTVWIPIIPTSTFYNCVFLFFFSFFFFFSAAIVDFINCKQYICALFTVPQITLFNNFFIKNGSHSTIYIFKNYFTTAFSVSAKISSIQINPITLHSRRWQAMR